MTEPIFDSHALHRDAIAEWITIAEQVHAKYDNHHPGTITRESAIAAVVLEAEYGWWMETEGLARRGNISDDDYREVTAEATELVRTQADSIIFKLAPKDVRRQSLDAALSAIYGPDGDDS